MVQAADFAKTLQLTVLSPSTQTEWDIRTTDLNRPGMQFCGFYEYFPFERPQVIGKVEMTYLENLEPEVRRQMLKKYFSFDIPCVIICRGMHPPEELLEAAAARHIAAKHLVRRISRLPLVRIALRCHIRARGIKHAPHFRQIRLRRPSNHWLTSCKMVSEMIIAH